MNIPTTVIGMETLTSAVRMRISQNHVLYLCRPAILRDKKNS